MANFESLDINSLVSILEHSTHERFQLAWDWLLPRRHIWRQLATLGPERCTGLLNVALLSWQPQLRTSKLALLVHELSGVAMVHSESSVYKEAFIYALSLLWEVDSVVTLNETIAAAAFGMARNNTKAVNTPKKRGDDGVEHGDDDDNIDLPYDEVSISLAPWFCEAWNRSRDADCDRLDVRKALETLPYISEIPRKAQDNNHNSDGKQFLDETVKAWQQKLLHGLRMLGNISVADGKQDTYTEILQTFHLLADLEQSLCDFRKTQSIRGSVAHSNQLFNKEELANANLASTINKLSRPNSFKGRKGGKGSRGWGSNFRSFGKGQYNRGRGFYGNSYGNSYSKPFSPPAPTQGPHVQGSQ